MNFLNTLYILRMRVLRRYHLLGLLSIFLHASTVYPHPKNRNIRHTHHPPPPTPPPPKKKEKKNLKFCDPPKTFPLCTLALKKTLKCIEMTPKIAQFVIGPKIYQQFLRTPPLKKIHFFFRENLKKYWNLKFWTPKNGPRLRIILKYQSNPHLHPERYHSISPGKSVVGWTDRPNKTIASLNTTVSSFKTTVKSPHSLLLMQYNSSGAWFFQKANSFVYVLMKASFLGW